MSTTRAPAPKDAATLRTHAVIAWVVTAVGTTTFHLVHLYSAIGQVALLPNGQVHDHDHDHGAEHADHLDFYASVAEHNSGASWQLAIFLTLMVIPPIIGLVSSGRASAITMTIVGLVSSIGMALDGFGHGFGEGAWSTLMLTVVAILLPAAVAAVKCIQWFGAIPASRRGGQDSPPSRT